MVRIWIEIVTTIDRTAEIGSKKSIKSRFEYNLDRILAGGRSNRISLVQTDLNCNIAHSDQQNAKRKLVHIDWEVFRPVAWGEDSPKLGQVTQLKIIIQKNLIFVLVFGSLIQSYWASRFILYAIQIPFQKSNYVK